MALQHDKTAILIDINDILVFEDKTMKHKEKDKWAIIVNPAAGNGRAANFIPFIEKMKRDDRRRIEIFVTRKSGHASQICSTLIKKGFRKFIAVGGDGTFNEVIQPLAKSGGCTLGVFPSGSGNDYAPASGFFGTMNQNHILDFFRCREVEVDAGICNGRYFLNNVGFGFDAAVARDFAKTKWIKGKLSYIFNVLKNFFLYNSSKCSVSSGGSTFKIDALLVSAGIGRSCGGGFHLTPNALIDDGLFDICAVENIGLAGKLLQFFYISNRKHMGKKGIRYFNSESIKLKFDKKVDAHIDGEIFEGKSFEVSIKPKAFKLLVHPGRTNYLSA